MSDTARPHFRSGRPNGPLRSSSSTAGTAKASSSAGTGFGYQDLRARQDEPELGTARSKSAGEAHPSGTSPASRYRRRQLQRHAPFGPDRIRWVEMDARMQDVTYETALARSGALEVLAAYDPHIVGTLPLDIAIPGSDIDIACHAPDPLAFASAVWTAFASCERFSIHQWVGGGRPVVASFRILDWDIEIFGAHVPVREQPAWRHFDIERRLLDLVGPGLRSDVMQLRLAGLKTEPAFAAAIGLKGDAYVKLLELQTLSDHELASVTASLRL